MADFQNAGYRLLSFQYTPPSPAIKEQKEDDDTLKDQATTRAQADGDSLPCLASLLTSLEEIEADSDKSVRAENDSGVELGEHDTKGKLEVHGDDNANVHPPERPEQIAPPSSFHRFPDLPTEIRLKIWALTFVPRVVELRPTRPNYSRSRMDDALEPQVRYLYLHTVYIVMRLC